MQLSKEQIKELLRRDEQRGDMGEIVQRMLDNPDRYNESLGRFGRIYTTTVNYDLGFDRLQKAADQSGGIDSAITALHFPLPRTGIREVGLELYEFDGTIKGPEAEEQINADGYQMEGIPEGWAFAKDNPLLQLRRPIVCARDRWQDRDGNLRVPSLHMNDGRRYSGLRWFEVDFDPYFRFLVSRKPAQP